MSVQIRDYNSLQYTQEPLDLTQACYCLDPTQMEQSLTSIPSGQLIFDHNFVPERIDSTIVFSR